MRNTFLLITILNIITWNGISAQNGRITGVISDRISNEKIPFANVVAIDKTGKSSVKGTLSDVGGKFIIENLPTGLYDMLISFIGYQTDTVRNVSIDKQSQQVNLGEIKLDVIVVPLSEIVVKDDAKTSITKIDRTTYRVQDFKTAKGGNASDVLSKLPSVSIDQEGIISVRGTSDFLVYLNGKPSQTEPSLLLTQIAESTIESIDIITVPSARYDAQGKGGIINITTKKTTEKGISISANLLTGGAPWGNYTDKLSNYKMNDNRLGGSLTFIYNKNRLSVYGGLNSNRKNVNGTRPGYARLLQGDGSYYHMAVSDGLRPEWFENFSANSGIDYKLNNLSSLSLSYSYATRNDGRSAFYNYHTFYADELKSPISGVPVADKWFYNPNKKNRYGVFHTASVDFTKKSGNNSELKISALYEHSKLSRDMENTRYYSNSSFDFIGGIIEHFIQSDETPLDGYRLSVDYSKKLNNGHKLGLGIQPQYFLTSGAFSYDTLNILSNVWGDYKFLENNIDFRRGVYAGYADYTGNLGKIQFIAGIRLEYTDQSLHMENPDYFTIFNRVKKSRYEVQKLDWFPSLHLNYDISENNKITLATSRRISRPPLINMAPFLYREHFEVYVVGDPALEPEYLTSIEIALNNKTGKQNFNIVGFYRGTDNAVFRVNTVYQPEKVLIRSYTNSANTRATGLELAMNLVTGKFARFTLSSSVYNFRVEGDIFGYRENNRSTNWSLKGNANFNLTGFLKLTTDFDIKSATVTAQGQDKMLYMTNIALNYTPKWLKGWDFTIKGLDILRSNITGLNTHAFDENGTQIFYQEIEYDRFGPIVELSLSYSFNMKGKSTKKTESSFGKEQF
jgi:outer membrane receptor protein involved in Fe transport